MPESKIIDLLPPHRRQEVLVEAARAFFAQHVANGSSLVEFARAAASSSVAEAKLADVVGSNGKNGSNRAAVTSKQVVKVKAKASSKAVPKQVAKKDGKPSGLHLLKAEDVEAAHDLIKVNPGLSCEKLRVLAPKLAWRSLLVRLREEKKVKVKGKARATAYFSEQR